MIMQRILFTAILASLSSACWAGGQNAEIAALRSECAAKNPVKLASQAKGANEYHFVYHKAEYRGEQRAGKPLACAESQYAAYLDQADPARVMSAYPTAAGRPGAKPATK
jgi:hypothetical protein